ncbi:hypothetical protein Zmor_019860 [Zophobas morio]|uniref:Uncharacterized protein n=1 Tax=Zophobas morio TaxID=2755281 RepID=A0AA38M9G5_9CUCU|nr:hypothetical protein Zmor_019860 [Zophobas morio]
MRTEHHITSTKKRKAWDRIEPLNLNECFNRLRIRIDSCDSVNKSIASVPLGRVDNGLVCPTTGGHAYGRKFRLVTYAVQRRIVLRSSSIR